MTTKEDIKEWFKRGKEKGAIYLLVICDTFDWQDYPVFCDTIEEAQKARTKYLSGENMQKLMEIYDLRGNMSEQIKVARYFAEIK